MFIRKLFSGLRQPRALKRPPHAQQRIVIVLLRSSIGRHLEVFREVIETVSAGLTGIGYENVVMVNEFAPPHDHIVFCPHLLQAQDVARIPPSSILYNFEPLDPPVFDSVGTFLNQFAPRFQVWDYSAANVAYLVRRGCTVQHVPLGYAPVLTRIARTDEQDIDVFFYGDLSARRERVLNALRRTGLNVVIVSDVYGPERDALIARSKVVLNIHNHDGIKALETPRVFYLLANAKAVVTEAKEDVEIEPDLCRAMVRAPYDRLVEACIELVHDAKRRRVLEQTGLECMKARNEERILAGALDRSR